MIYTVMSINWGMSIKKDGYLKNWQSSVSHVTHQSYIRGLNKTYITLTSAKDHKPSHNIW